MRAFLIAIATWFFLSFPAHASVPGDGRPVVMAWCFTIEFAEQLSLALVGKPNGSLPGGCTIVSPFFPTDLSDQKLVIGPLRDFDNDPFAVFEVHSPTDPTRPPIYAFVWWGAPRFNPTGWGV